MNYAFVVFDSDELPPRWIFELNKRFDLVIVPSPHLVRTAKSSGVEKPIACVPIALDIESLLASPYRRPRPDKTRFVSVAAFHPRKGTTTLVDAFADRFGSRQDVELVLHSNLSFENTFARVQRSIAECGLTNVRATCGALSRDDKNALIDDGDVFVNCSRGEGYSIGPREALALGKPLVLSGVGGHLDLARVPGVFVVPAEIRVPARYPEIDNLVFGEQRLVEPEALGDALQRALAYARSDACYKTAFDRRAFARNFTFGDLATSYAELINTALGRFRTARPRPIHVRIPEDFRHRVDQTLGRRAERLGFTRNIVTAAYDGGFFSLFNAFMSHLVWNQREERCHAVLPDWDAGRLLERENRTNFVSFCYGRPDEGNVWLKVFKPLYGLTEADMNSRDFLYAHASFPEARHNERREPLMTYVHAYKLYKSHDFAAWRRQYHRVFAEHVHLRPELQDEIDSFTQSHFERNFMVAAHVRHPSHTMEQPDGTLAQNQVYVDHIREKLRERGIDEATGNWGLFLATDQDRAIRAFQSEFGRHVIWFRDVRRTREEEDCRFDKLSPEDKHREGHQVQHLVASDPGNWSSSHGLGSRARRLRHCALSRPAACRQQRLNRGVLYESGCGANPMRSGKDAEVGHPANASGR